MKSGVLLVRDREGLYEEILIDIDYNGFSYDYAKNTSRQITFTVFQTKYNKYSFDLLTGDAVIVYDGQEFIIKQCTPKVVGSLQTKDITAAHISFTVQDHYQYNSKESSAEYSLEDVMKFAIGGNELDFTYEIIGSFEKKTIESISANDALSLINDIACGTFGAIFYADNKKLYLYSEDEWYREVQQTFRYQYNTNEVSVSEDITPIKTFIKAYGKEKENKDTKSDQAISQTSVNFSAKWTDGVTTTKDSTASFEFTGTGVDVYFNKSKYGGKVHIDVDGANSKSGTTYSEKSGTLTLTIRGLENKKHNCNIKFTGVDSTNPNTKKVKHQEAYNVTDKEGKIVRKTKTVYTQEAATLEVNNPVANVYLENEGDDRYEAVVTYLSPAYKQWDKKMAAPVSNDKITDEDELLEFAKSQLQDYPDMSLNIIYTGKELVDVRDVWLLIHEPLGISSDVKLVSLRSPHPYTGQPQTLTFSSAHKDMLKIQNQLRKSVTNLSKQLSGVNSTISGNLPSLQAASKAIAAVSGNIEFDPDKGLKTTRKIKTSTSSTATVQTATISAFSSSPTYVTDFLNKIKNGAMETWNTHGILPSITAAQGALESNWGRSTLTIDCNNLFGIKAGSSWTGEKKAYRTAEQDANGNVYYVTAYFRAYGSWAESILDHGQFFHDNSRYAAVIGLTDYTAQAQAIKAAGYATDTEYVSKLTSIIEAHNLASWDAAAISNEYVPGDDDSFEETEEESGSVYIGNGSISVVGEDGIESDVITPDGVDLSKSYGSFPDEVLDDMLQRIGLSADYMYLTSPNGTRFMFNVDDNGNLSMIKADENTQ